MYFLYLRRGTKHSNKIAFNIYVFMFLNKFFLRSFPYSQLQSSSHHFKYIIKYVQTLFLHYSKTGCTISIRTSTIVLSKVLHVCTWACKGQFLSYLQPLGEFFYFHSGSRNS